MKRTKGTAALVSVLVAAPAYAGVVPQESGMAQSSTATNTGSASTVAAPQSSTSDQPTPEAAAPGDIIVTAQRRSENLNRVAISVVAASGDALLSKGITAPDDLVKIVPGLTAAPTPYGNTVLTLRGVGFYESSLAASSPVASYIDETPLPFSRLANGATLDLQRVEVLKGPQGTLYGQNATGGAVNYITNKPTDEFHAGIDGSFGRFLDTDVQEYVSGPITDTLKIRVAAREHVSEGWQESITRDATLGAARFFTGRVLLDWTPVSKLKFELNVNGYRDRSDTPAVASTSFHPNNPGAVTAAELSAPLTPTGNDRLADWDPDKQFRRDNGYFQTALRTNYAIDDQTNIVAITAYNFYDQDQLLDTDGTDVEANAIRQRGSIRAFSQELRLQGTISRLQYSVGGNYEHDRIKDYEYYIGGDSSTDHAIPSLPFSIGETHSDQAATTYAGFADASYQLTSTLKLQGGVRYTHQSRDFTGCLGDPGPVGGGGWARFFSFIYQTTIPEGGCTTLNPATGVIGPYSGSRTEHNVAWRSVVNYQPSSATLLYASVSRGYNQGSYPTVGGASTVQYAPAKQESLLAYEVGAKLGLFDRRIQLNSALFYYDYRDKQLRGKYADPIFGTIEELFNIPKSRVYGAELQVATSPVSGLNLQGSFTYANSRILSDFPSLSPIGAPINLRGESFELTPEWSANASVNYERPVSASLRAFAEADITYQGSQHGGYGNDPLFAIKDYALVDLMAGVHPDGDRWRVQLFVRNVANKYYWTNANYLAEYTYRQLGMPRTFGVRVAYKY